MLIALDKAGASTAEVRPRAKTVEVELTARGLKSFGLDNPSIVPQVRLPDYEGSTVLAWPPPQVPWGVQYVASMVLPRGPGENWLEEGKRRGQALREEAARVATYHAEIAPDREARERALINQTR